MKKTNFIKASGYKEPLRVGVSERRFTGKIMDKIKRTFSKKAQVRETNLIKNVGKEPLRVRELGPTSDSPLPAIPPNAFKTGIIKTAIDKKQISKTSDGRLYGMAHGGTKKRVIGFNQKGDPVHSIGGVTIVRLDDKKRRRNARRLA